MKTLILVTLTIYLLYQAFPSGYCAACIKTYTNMSIAGYDIQNISSVAESACCGLCNNTKGCKAWVWTSSNSGTCTLKNGTQPLYIDAGATTGIMQPDSNNTYSMIKEYANTNFFNDWWFDNRAGHVFGWSNFTDQATAEKLGLYSVQNGKVYMGVDHTNIIPNNSVGRPSFRINSNQQYSAGLFIVDLAHMPIGPGTWPSFWMDGVQPQNGEIDIFEGYSIYSFSFTTIHGYNGNCTLPTSDKIYFNGSIYQGTSVTTPSKTYNYFFNDAGGGVYALQWDRENFIKVWVFLNTYLPEDIANESPNPNPDTWGMPNAYFPLGANCPPNLFYNQSLLFDIAFCGGWTWNYPGGETQCEHDVRYNPQNFTDAYFLLNYVKVFCRPGEPCNVQNPDGK